MMDGSADNKDKDVSWTRLVYDFTQDTTFHGVRYITADTQFVLRRILWALIVLLAFTVFVWFLSTRLIFLNTNPKAVDVEVIYTNNVLFPAVTICNQNLFRTSATHKLGLHDIVSDSFRKLQVGDEDGDGEDFEMTQDMILLGIGKPHAIYIDITAEVCRHACSEIHGDSCCSLVYDRGTRTCQITPLELNATGVSLVPKLYTDYYRRTKCEVKKGAFCDFEDGFCDFDKDMDKALTWIWANPETRYKLTVTHPKYDHTTTAGFYPDYDHTKTSGDGNYLLATTKYPQPNTEAHLVSPYILSGPNTCIQLYYQIWSGTLNIKVKSQTKTYTTYWSRSNNIPNTKGTSHQVWQRAYQKLPQGYWRIIIEARSGSGNDRLAIAIDDIKIEQCVHDQASACKQTSSGVGFTGQLFTSRSGLQCQPWKDVYNFYYLRPVLWRAQDSEVVARSLPEWQNYCRNPNGDENGPWCFTDLKAGRMEYCDVPRCGCRDVEFTCDNGQCLPTYDVCNGQNDCGDNSDEIRGCNRTESVNCNFDDDWMCGYHNNPNSPLTWTFQEKDGQSAIGIELKLARDGDVFTLTSPYVYLDSPACLHLDYSLSGNTQLDVSYQRTQLQFDRDHLCTIRPGFLQGHGLSTGSWNATDILLPVGRYKLLFDAVLYSVNDADVFIDNITILDENCTLRELIIYDDTTAYPETTEPYYTNSTVGNYSYVNTTTTTDWGTTVEMTTAPPRDQYLYLHQTMEHGLCQNPVNTSCGMCTKHVGLEAACYPVITQISLESGGNSSGCEHIPGGGPKHTLDSCKIEAFALGGNVINFQATTGRCYVKNCTGGRLKMNDRFGGFDVYEINFAAERMGMSCTFEDECLCGYKHMASNIGDQWIHEISEEEIITYNENGTANGTQVYVNNYMKVRRQNGQRPMKHHRVWLISPQENIEKPSCLSFRYILSYVNYDISTYTSDGLSPLMQIMHDGQDGVWHKAYTNIPTGRYGLAFGMSFGSMSVEDNGIDDVSIKEGHCWKEAIYGTFECTFDDDDYCGYQDVSNGTVKWIRSKDHSEASPGGYYLRSSHLLNGKGSTILESPTYTINNISCVQFYYFLQGPSKLHLSTFSLSVVLPNHRYVSWKIRTITDNKWHFAQTEIVFGTFKLSFELSGNDIRAGLDDIVIVDGTCPERNCTDEEYMCGGSMACIPASSECDGMPNCDLGEDEDMYSCGGNETLAENPEDDVENNDEIDTGGHVKLTENSVIGSSLGLREIYHRAGHQGEDLIYSCRWGGEPCSYTNFTKTVTDYGLCYTFNSEERPPLNTDKTGSRFGLGLTMNIEQYEYMRGPQSDAGIKVFLHHKDDVPQVRDLGFAIAPGVHSLVAIRLNEAENLPEPHGKCSEKPLMFYNKYVHSRCMRECELGNILKACNCRDAYMPGNTDDDPVVCNLTWYFTCAIPAINSDSANTDCDCPKPCQQTIYEPGLSQAALSILSVDNILSRGLAKLTTKYNEALDWSQRIEPDTFVKDLTLIRDIAKSYLRLRQFAKTYLGDFEKSSLAKIWIASSTLVNIFQQDIEILFADLDSQRHAFIRYYEQKIELIQRYITDMEHALQEMEQLFKLFIDIEGENKFAHFFGALASTIVSKGTIGYKSFEMFHDKLAAKRNTDDESNERFLPMYFTISDKTCISDIKLMADGLHNIINMLSAGAVKMNMTQLTADYNRELRSFRRTSAHVMRCISEYKDTLSAVYNWKTDVLQEADALAKQSPFFGETFNFTEESHIIENDENNVEDILFRYSYAEISKLDYLRHFDPDEQSSTVVSHIKTFTNRIKMRLTDPLRERIYEIQRLLQSQYEESMQLASAFEPYFEPFYYHSTAKDMTIWRVPIANLENPERSDDIGREMWNIWNREQTDTATFVKLYSAKYIIEGLDSFCHPLQKTLDEFEEQLFIDQEKLLNALNRVHREQERYLLKREIDHKFVLDNFLNIDVYFAQLKHQNVKQMVAYDVTQFLGDVGGFMGLLLGGSVITVFELLDLIVFNFLTNLVKKADSKPGTPEEKPALQMDEEACIDDMNLRYGGVYGAHEGEKGENPLRDTYIDRKI